jgi:hypothetical protein
MKSEREGKEGREGREGKEMDFHYSTQGYSESSEVTEIPEWEKLDSELREDLALRAVTSEIWSRWNDDQRHRLVNARAVLLDSGVWNLVSMVGFGKLVIERKKYGRCRTFFTLQENGWFLAIRTREEVGTHLRKAGWSNRWNPNHPENRANWMQPGKGIVMHLGELKFPANAYSSIHWDYGGGRIYRRDHLREFVTGKGPSNDKVTIAIGKTTASNYLRGISEGIDKLLAS